MARPEWGTKRTGPCGTKFYDFNKSPIICPGCGGKVVTNEVKTKTNINEIEKNLESNSENKALSEESSKDIVLDNSVLDDDIIRDDVNLDKEVDSDLEDNIDNEEIDLINDANDIVLDVEIDEDK